MNDIVRKLATIRRIAEVKPIEGADKIEAYRVDGWWVVSQKNAFKVDQFCAYFEVDSFLPQLECFEFLRSGCFKSTKNLGDGYRLRTIKMRGQISQGLIMPLEDFPEIMGKMYVGGEFVGYHPAIPIEEGTDVTELLGVKKYERPIPSNLAGTIRGNFPSFVPKTDQERYQNLKKVDLNNHKDDFFEITIKYDGSSMTVYHNDGDFGVCSRNLDLKETEENTYWQVANKLNLKEILERLYEDKGLNLAFQGELCGPGVQNNPMRFTEHSFNIYDIYDITNHKYLTPLERWQLLDDIHLKYGYILNHVYVVDEELFRLGDKLFDFDFLMEMTEMFKLKDKKTNDERTIEGLVFKNEYGDFSFKIISNSYLLEND